MDRWVGRLDGSVGCPGLKRSFSPAFACIRAIAVGLALLMAIASAGCSPLMAAQPTPSPTGLPAKSQADAPVEVQKPFYYPERPVTLLVGARRGARADFAARLLVPRLEKVIGQPVVVVNREDGDGLEAWTQLKQAKPDGYTLALISSPQIQAMALDPQRPAPFAMGDFVPLAGQTQDPVAIFVRASSPFQRVEDLIGAARAQPDGISVSVPVGSLVDSLAAAELRKAAGIKLRIVEYTDSTNAVMAALSGQAEAEFGNAADIAPSVRSGQGRFLAILDEKRLQEEPQIPTLKEKGIDVVSCSQLGYAAPKGVAGDIVAYLTWAIYLAVSDQQQQARMRDAGLVVRYANGEQYGKLLSAQGERVKQLLPIAR